uniref:Uncharacterized protein n=1 Tax=Catharus ustulatus TaxID=91951 RepID=A0A8C3V919_CATUS
MGENATSFLQSRKKRTGISPVQNALPWSEGSYYLLGLRYSPEEQKWKWINNVEFSVHGPVSGYHCTVIGFGEVRAAPCHGTQSTQNMCEKTVTM